MGGNKECSRDDCPLTNIQKIYTTKCGNCGSELHLPCIGIDRKVCEVQFHRNIRVYCNACSNLLPVGIFNADAAKKVVKPSSFSSGNLVASSSETEAKIDSIAALLSEVRDIARDTNKKVTLNVASSQSYADVAKKMDEIKEITAKTNAKVNEKFSDNQIAPFSTEGKLNIFPSLGTPNKRKRMDSSQPLSVPPSRKYFGRNLVHGTANVTNHGLGDRVDLKESQGLRPRLTKAIYVSRMKNTVTSEKLLSYIKSQMPELNESEVSLRLLVKKDVDVSTRRFISYRLACNEDLYDKFMDPSFWPDHIEIGEFFEDARERSEIKLATFDSPQIASAKRSTYTARTSAVNICSVGLPLIERNKVIGASSSSSSSTTKNDASSVMEIS